ncbi:hypothetical protein LXA43DRAFT_66191 [Ganoderma leucocontextum]|nr:hypothetical protein LXA43DRAFT_66191 [Ganoderma leucocontextum]
MSTPGSLAPDPISTLLVAMESIWRDSPQKPLEHVSHVIGSRFYGFLDALATLCAFAPQCDAAAAVMGCERNDGRLYISVKPVASPELRVLVQELLDLVKSLPDTTPSTVLGVSEGFDVETFKSLDMATPDHQIIISIYRACHAKFRVCATRCRALLTDLPKRGQRGFRDEWDTLSEKLNYLLDVASRDVDEVSDAEFLGLYYTVDDVLRSTMPMRKVLPSIVYSAMQRLEPLPRAVRTILAMARKERRVARHWDVCWIDSSATQTFRASVDEDYIRTNFGVVADKSIVWPPPETLEKDPEPTSQCVTGLAVVHPEAALLDYVWQHKVNVSGHIGVSPPTCYPCFMLLWAFNAQQVQLPHPSPLVSSGYDGRRSPKDFQRCSGGRLYHDC